MKFFASSRPAIVVACGIISGCSAPKNIASSEWQPQAVVVDGKADEWQQPLRYANTDTKLNYSISNDNEKLYFCFITSDRRSAAKIMMGGLQVRLDAEGKDDTPVTLLYPIPGRVKFPARSKEADNSNPPHFDRQQMMNDANTLEVSGLPFAKQSTELPLINKFGVNVATGFAGEDRFVYEGSIPLQDLPLKGKDIDITITIKGIARDHVPNAGRQGGGNGAMSGGMGGGGMGGGGMRGGHHGGGGRYGGGQGRQQMGGGNSSSQTMFADQKIKMKMRLAEK